MLKRLLRGCLSMTDNGSGLCEGQGIELQIFKNSTNDR
jgi:hypothetical protein